MKRTAMVASAVAALGRVDVLVNNAGVMERAPFLAMSEVFWKRVLDINLGGAFRCGQAVARRMVAQGGGGRIVNVASNSGVFGGRGRAAYGASKAGMINLTQTMAIELAAHDILVNAVAPGPTRTRDTQPEQPDELVLARMPLAVSADVKLTHIVGVNLTHLGEDRGIWAAIDVDPGAGSGDTSVGPSGDGDQGDRARGGLLAQYDQALPA